VCDRQLFKKHRLEDVLQRKMPMKLRPNGAIQIYNNNYYYY